VSHPATVRLADKLEAEGLLESRQGRDRRSVALYLTAKGRAYIDGLLAERTRELAAVTGVLSPAEQDQLAGLLEKMLRAVTVNPQTAAHICRLCDGDACPEDACPVHQTAQRPQPPA
jgi:DNA-binding PadR family transcriptional regulator